jgi:serine/threonine protein kinase
MAAVPAPDTPGGPNFLRWLQFRVSGSTFECPSVYQLVKPIGKGAYGIVCAAIDSRSNQQVAIKKIGDIFANPLDARRTLREIQILRHVRGHSNIITLLDLFPPSCGIHDFRDVYMVYEIMDTDLHQIIRSPQPLSEEHIQFFVYQLLRGLKYLHTGGVVHRDLKPSNLLLNGNCELRICDFGLARAEVNQELMAEYVVTRWYRAPELLLSCSDYGPPIDMWSVGCILAELLGRKPLFPGAHCSVAFPCLHGGAGDLPAGARLLETACCLQREGGLRDRNLITAIPLIHGQMLWCPHNQQEVFLWLQHATVFCPACCLPLQTRTLCTSSISLSCFLCCSMAPLLLYQPLAPPQERTLCTSSTSSPDGSCALLRIPLQTVSANSSPRRQGLCAPAQHDLQGHRHAHGAGAGGGGQRQGARLPRIDALLPQAG